LKCRINRKINFGVIGENYRKRIGINQQKTDLSKAYINAMKTLQLKIKSLEEENKEIFRVMEEKERVKEEEIVNCLKENSKNGRIFEGLERNLKERNAY
jgi:hypothetical protein